MLIKEMIKQGYKILKISIVAQQTTLIMRHKKNRLDELFVSTDHGTGIFMEPVRIKVYEF